jgi:CheY-like chemotaxis protein
MTNNTIVGEPAPNDSRAGILVVEDDVITRTAISEELREDGYQVIEAANADEALSVLLGPIRVDLVLTDMKMPGRLDGGGLVREIRAQLPYLKVLMVAGQRPEPDVMDLLDGYISKPVTPSRLVSVLRTLLPPRPRGDASP